MLFKKEAVIIQNIQKLEAEIYYHQIQSNYHQIQIEENIQLYLQMK